MEAQLRARLQNAGKSRLAVGDFRLGRGVADAGLALAARRGVDPGELALHVARRQADQRSAQRAGKKPGRRRPCADREMGAGARHSHRARNFGGCHLSVAAQPSCLNFIYRASWKMMPSVWRWPERSRLTPWRRLTRYG